MHHLWWLDEYYYIWCTYISVSSGCQNKKIRIKLFSTHYQIIHNLFWSLVQFPSHNKLPFQCLMCKYSLKYILFIFFFLFLSFVLVQRAHMWMWCGAVEQGLHAAQWGALWSHDELSLGNTRQFRVQRLLTSFITVGQEVKCSWFRWWSYTYTYQRTVESSLSWQHTAMIFEVH